MTTTRWAAEQEAYRGFSDLLVEADRVRERFDRAGLELPLPLKRLLGMTETPAKAPPGVVIPPPQVPRPSLAGTDWLSVDVSDATPTTVVPAVLRQQKSQTRVKDLVALVLSVLPNVSGGSVTNTLSRLKTAGVIDRGDEGWFLTKPEAAAILHEGRLWGPPSVFQKTEIASHRRDAILHILARFPSGLQVLQIVERLRTCDWLHAPLNKDLVKEDMNALFEDKKVRRRGNTKKWELSPERGEP